MAQLVVRNLEDDVKIKLRALARRHGRSTEEEVRQILRNAVIGKPEAEVPLGRRWRMLFEAIGLDEDIPEWRGYPAAPADVE
ncbi:MAG: plasmid stabilization protein [Rhodospirillales bacterium]|nr:plasmid stabilization protein [Rhodospirillales bacterium]